MCRPPLPPWVSAAGLFALLLVVLFAPGIAAGRAFGAADIAYRYAPWAAQRPPGWAQPANELFRGVAVTAGRCRVRFRFEPASFRLGAAISLVAFAGLAVGLALAARRP